MKDEKLPMNPLFSLMTHSYGSEIRFIGDLEGFMPQFLRLMMIGLAQPEIT